MRLNEHTVILGSKVLLVPYRPEHVPRYHEWMKSAELQELTASEPLTLEQEYEMQRDWHEDPNKLTFILLAHPEPAGEPPVFPLSAEVIGRSRMIGDVNMFLPDGPEGEGECEIMIADPLDRRKGYALEAIKLFLAYATQNIPISPDRLIARIGETNRPSIRLFEQLGFGISRRVEVFNEVEMRFGYRPEKETGGSGASGASEASEASGVEDVRVQGDWRGMDLSGVIARYE